MDFEFKSSYDYQILGLSLKISSAFILLENYILRKKKNPILKIGFCKLGWGQGIWILKASQVI